MLSEQDYEQYLDDLKLDASGRDFISNIRSSPPARAVGAVRKHNVCGQLFSEKMGCTIQYESRTGEALFAWDAEYDDEVLEFYDQPVTIPIEIVDKRGRRNRTSCTPDYMTLRRIGITFHEVKPLQELRKLVLKRPTDWVELDGVFFYRPAESAFRERGCVYQVVAAESLSQRRAHNIKLLLRSRSKSETSDSKKRLDRLVKHVKRYGPLPMDRALDDVGESDSTFAVIAVDRGHLFTDISKCLLSDSRSAWLSPEIGQVESIETASKGYLDGGLSIGLILETDFPGPGEHKRILQRLAKINGTLPADVHPSTIRRWKARLAKDGGNPAGLASHYPRCGPRGARIHKNHLVHLLTHYTNTYGTSEARSERAVHRDYVVKLKNAEGWTESWGSPVCLETYHKYVSKQDPEVIQRKRGGNPAGNAAALPVNPDKVGLVSQYAFEVAQIDHYLADCFVVVAKTATKVYCARPWVTLMVDTYSKCALGLWIGLSAPSRKAVAMVIRDCARRHGRLPNCIRIDNGADFQSVYFDLLIAYLRISKEYRPACDPRYGSEVERLFRTFREEFLDDQPGNIRNNERNRSVAKAFKGEAVAAMDMGHFFRVTEEYLFNDYVGYPRTGNTKAPSILLAESLEGLSVAGVAMRLDAKLMLATAVEAPSKSYRISPVDGIRVDQHRYRSSEIQGMIFRGTKKAEIKLEPYDDSFIYVHDSDLGIWHIAQTISASLDLAPTDSRTKFETLLRREGADILKGIKLERDMHYVTKRGENRRILAANGIDFLDLTDTAYDESSTPQTRATETASRGQPKLRQIEQFAGFE